jgi:hypothetical protein
MDWTNPPATEHEPASGGRPGQGPRLQSPSTVPNSPGGTEIFPSNSPDLLKPPELRVGKTFSFTSSTSADSGQDVFTLTLGPETIELLPLKSWSQLDHYKWTARGKLPGEPAGLEIAVDHVKLTGEIVSIKDPAGCAKLERLFNEWLLLERETQKLVRQKANWHPPVTSVEPSAAGEPSGPRFRVELDKRGQVHVHCAQGRNTVATIGLTVAGFNSLCQQGLMRKPRKLDIGALHDWVELDGELCSFEKGQDDSARLEQILNERYVPEGPVGAGLEIVIYQNAASPTGFDIQFPVQVAGVPHSQRQHLNDQSLELLQDPHRCGLLRAEIIPKLIPPNLVFKRKTPDGGEQYLASNPENTVTVAEEGGQTRTFDLSHPLNLLRLNAAELTAVFCHPTINRQAKKAAPAPRTACEPQPQPIQASPPTQILPRPVPPAPPPPLRQQPLPPTPPPVAEATETVLIPAPPPPVSAPRPVAIAPTPKPVEAPRPLPNLWLSEVLARPALPPDWFTNLVYGKMAERFGNSSEGKFGPWACWFISLAESEDIDEPAFKGIFLTEKGSLGFLNEGQMARFHNGVAFLGTRESALEGIEVDLVGVGVDAQERVVFILSDNYRARFGVPEATLTDVVRHLNAAGAVIMSVREVLTSREPLAVVWTVPAEQSDPENPEALESNRP